MKTMEFRRDLIERLDRLTHEVNQIKSALVYQIQPDRRKAARAWRDLMKASDEISSLWSGDSALEEIQAQRES